MGEEYLEEAEGWKKRYEKSFSSISIKMYCKNCGNLNFPIIKICGYS